MTLRCVIVDDSAAVLRALSQLLVSEGIAVVGVAATGEHAITLTEQLKPDVVLVDIDLGPESGFELARKLAHAESGAGPRTILISTNAEVDFANMIAASPAIGFVSKSDLSATAIRRLLSEAQEEGSG